MPWVVDLGESPSVLRVSISGNTRTKLWKRMISCVVIDFPEQVDEHMPPA